MAINKIDWPTASTPVYTPDIETDYNNQNENLECVVRGYNAVSLTNWDATTTAPEVATGSVIECNGVLYDITTDTSIGTSGASSGTIYLTFNDATTPTFEWVDTAPTWSDTLNGWYVSDDRFTGHACDWDGSTSFTAKNQYSSNSQGGGALRLASGSGGGSYSTYALSSAGTWIPDAGGYVLGASAGGYVYEMYDGSSTWYSAGTTGLVIFDGTNYRLRDTAGGVTVYYRKLW